MWKRLDMRKQQKRKAMKKINATQMTSISTQQIQQFQQKDKLFIYSDLYIILFVE